MPLFPTKLDVNVHVHHHFPGGDGPLRDLMAELKEQLVSALSDAIAALNASADALLARVKTDVDALTAERDRLQAQIDAGGATPENMKALADVKAKIDAAEQIKSVVVPEPTPAPEPPPVAGP